MPRWAKIVLGVLALLCEPEAWTECQGSCFVTKFWRPQVQAGTSFDAFKDSFGPRSLYCLYRAQTSLEAQAGTFWSSQHFDCGKPVIAEHWNSMNSSCCSAVLDVFRATGWDEVDHKEFEAKYHGSGIRQQDIEEADDLVKGATRVLQSKSPLREQLSFHLLWKLFSGETKAAETGNQGRKRRTGANDEPELCLNCGDLCSLEGWICHVHVVDIVF